MASWRSTSRAIRTLAKRPYSTATPQTSPFAPRHLLSINDLSPHELTTLVRNAFHYKTAVKSGSTPKSLQGVLAGKTIAMPFSKVYWNTQFGTIVADRAAKH